MGVRIERAAGWLLAPAEHHREVRNELIATIIQRRPAVYISCAAVMIMSLSAALIAREAWAVAWLAVNSVLIGYRLYLSFRYDDGINDPREKRGAVLASMFALFLLFGLGCAACILTGPPVLVLMAVISVLGVFAGLVSRWAAFPRLALLTILAIGVPVCLAIILRAEVNLLLAAVQFTAIAVTIASQTVQNHRTLIRMMLAEHQNAMLARCDSLTGLGNRVSLGEELENALASKQGQDGSGSSAALLYLDLDGFKAFNDSYGHQAGDRLLRKVSDTIQAAAANSGIAYRIGGDEFVILCRDQDEMSAAQLAERIIATVPSTSLDIGDPGASVRISAGIAFARDEENPEALLRRADQALYAAKRAGKSRYRIAGEGTVRSLAA